MKSIATILAVAALSWSAAAAEPAEAADDLKSSLLRFEAWTAKNTGVSVFAWKPLHGAVAQASLLPEGETSHAVSDILQQCKDDSASLCRATFGQTLANDQQRFNAVQESMDCLHEHFERVSEPCVSAAHSAVDALGHEGLEVQQKVLARLADDTAQNMLSACSFDDVKQCAADEAPSEQHHKHGGRWRAMKASAGKPALGRDGHGQPPAHDGEHKAMLGRDGHGQPPAHDGQHKPMLGRDGHGQPPAHDGEHKPMLGRDGHGQPPAHDGEHKPMLGRDGHGQPPAHDGEHKPMLGRDGHGQPPAHDGEHKPMLGRDGHGQPPAHDGEHKPMLGRDGHGQPPARKASVGHLHPHGAPHHHRRGMRSMRRMRGEQAPHAPPSVSPEDAAQWFSAHSALSAKETAHLGSSIPAAAQCLAEQGHPDGRSWTHGWSRRAARAPTASPKCVKAAERWVQLANHGATVSEQSVQVQQKHTEQAPMPRDAWNMDVVLGNWGLEGVSAREHDGHPRWGGWEDDVDSPFHGWGDEEEFEGRHRHHGGALGVLPILLLPILLCFGIRRCARNKRRRAAMAAADGATNVPPPPARFAQGPSPQQAAAAAASHAAAAPAVHYPFAASAPAPPAPQQVQANLYPDVDQSTWNVSSWFGGQPSAPGYAPVSVREA